MSNVLYMLHMTGVSKRMYMMYLSLFSGVLRTVFERYLCIVYACRTNVKWDPNTMRYDQRV